MGEMLRYTMIGGRTAFGKKKEHLSRLALQWAKTTAELTVTGNIFHRPQILRSIVAPI